MDVAPQKVDCGTCRRCCIGQTIVLHPEAGDDPKKFVTRPGTHPVSGAPAYIIPQNADGSCFYLGAGGCTIWEAKPAMCSFYSCVRDFQKFTALSRPERRRRIRAGTLDMNLINRGAELAEAEEAK